MANRIVLGIIGLEATFGMIVFLTPWFPFDEWPCSEDGIAAATAALPTSCITNADCWTPASFSLYNGHTCNEIHHNTSSTMSSSSNNSCVWFDPKVCVTPINSPLLHRVAIGFYVYTFPMFVGIVAFLFRGRTNWKGSRLIAIGTVVVLLLHTTQLQVRWNQYSLGTTKPWCTADWAGLECDQEGADTMYFAIAKAMAVVLLLVFGRIAVWDSLISYQRQQPIRSSAGYVLTLSILIIFFPVSELQRLIKV
jgi:hypothetical protein